jgi:hypothetical protein
VKEEQRMRVTVRARVRVRVRETDKGCEVRMRMTGESGGEREN